MRRIFSCTVLIALALVLPCSCWREEPLTEEQQIVRDSLVQVGNTFRLSRAIQKAQGGEDITIAYLGGSITQGSSASPQTTMCYAYQSYEAFCDRFELYPKAVRYVNAGIGATNSLLGIERVGQDVLSYDPDIVFIEYAVNDNGSTETTEAYESLVRKVLEWPSEPAVILIFTVNEQGWNSEGIQKKIGYEYDLGMISVRSAIYQRMKKGTLQADAYFSPDGLHPNTQGHTLIAGFIDWYFEQVAQKKPEAGYTIPRETVHEARYQSMRSLESDQELMAEAVTAEGSFPYRPLKSWNWKKAWLHQADGGNDALTLTVTAKDIVLVYLRKGTGSTVPYGTALVSVDGGEEAALDGSNGEQWDFCAEHLLLSGGTAEPHVITLRMAPGSEEKAFALLGVGITR